MKVKLSLSGTGSWEALGILMETSIWQGHSSSSFISICGLSLMPPSPVWVFTRFTCLRVTFSAYTNFIHFQGRTAGRSRNSCVWTLAPARACPCYSPPLSLCSTVDRRIFGANHPCMREKHYTAAPWRTGKHHASSGWSCFCRVRLFACEKSDRNQGGAF